MRGSGRLRRAAAALLAIAVAGLSGCGYTLVGKTSNLPPNIKVIRFQTLVNKTTRVGVEQRLSSEVVRELASRGRFKVQPEAAGADADLAGEVTGFDFFAVAFDQNGRAREYQVRITAKMSLKSLPDEKVIWENPAFTFQDNYSLTTTAAAYVDLENDAIDRAAGRFAESLVSSLLEGF